MRSFTAGLFVAGALIGQSAATIYVTEPTASTICTAGTPCNVRWNDDGNAPFLAQIGVSSINLCTGGPQVQFCLQNVGMADVSTTAFVTYLPDASVGPNGNDYFIKYISQTFKDPANPAVPYTSFSAMFTLNGMTGTFNSTVQQAIDGVTTPAAAVSTPAAAASSSTPVVAKTTGSAAVASAAKSTASASAAANGAFSVTVPGVVSSTIGFGMIMSFASFFLGALAFGL